MGKERLWNKALIISICFHLGIMPCIGLILESYPASPLVKKPIELELVMSVAAQSLNGANPSQQADKINQPPQPKRKIPENNSPPVKNTPVNNKKDKAITKDTQAVIDKTDKNMEKNWEKETGDNSENPDKNSPSIASGAQAGSAGSGQNTSFANGTGGQPGKSGGYISPRLLSKVEPVYPERARAADREGTVTVSLEVLSTGQVGSVLISQSSGHADLDDAAVKAVKRWRFVPAKDSLSGQAITCLVNFPVVFKLKDTP